MTWRADKMIGGDEDEVRRILLDIGTSLSEKTGQPLDLEENWRLYQAERCTWTAGDRSGTQGKPAMPRAQPHRQSRELD